MTRPDDEMRGGVFGFDLDRPLAPDRETDALSMMSRRLIEASKDLRQRSTELRDEMMRKLSV